jgi:Leucine-rich repeat (LRR) protein
MTLDLSGNHLTSLPKNIAQLTSLRSLDLSDNQLTSLPLELLQLTNLKKLDLRRNPLPIPIRHRFRRAPIPYLARYQEDMIKQDLPS